MKTVPLNVLQRAVQALEKSMDRLNNQAAPDPYMDVLKARAELGYYVEQITKNTPVGVQEAA